MAWYCLGRSKLRLAIWVAWNSKEILVEVIAADLRGKTVRVLPIPTCGEVSNPWVGVLAEVIAADSGTWEAARNYRIDQPCLGLSN